MIVHDSWWSNGSACSTIIDYHEPFDKGLIHFLFTVAKFAISQSESVSTVLTSYDIRSLIWHDSLLRYYVQLSKFRYGKCLIVPSIAYRVAPAWQASEGEGGKGEKTSAQSEEESSALIPSPLLRSATQATFQARLVSLWVFWREKYEPWLDQTRLFMPPKRTNKVWKGKTISYSSAERFMYMM